MLDEIQSIIDELGPKNFSRRIKNTPDIWNWVLSKTEHLDNVTIAERVYASMSNESNICKNGNERKFGSIDQGYKFCGRANKCICCAESVSLNVSRTKLAKTDEENKKINDKREKTNLKKYGVTNTGQIEKAKNKHALYYSDDNNVKKQVQKHKQTIYDRYGVYNPRHIDGVNDKIKTTLLERFNVCNPMQNKVIASKSLQTRKEKYTKEYYLERSYKRINKLINDNHNVKFVTGLKDYNGVSGQMYYDFECLECNNIYSTYIDNGHRPICKKCNPTDISYKSKEELEVLAYIESLGFDVDSGNRSLINPYELDMVIHDKKIAIEYCGLYWHSVYSLGKDKKYHQRKMELCNNKGYRLITIFSDEWNDKKEIVKSKLSYIFGINDNKRVYARNTTIGAIKSEKVKMFFERYHIQGYCESKYHFGLFENDILLAVMSINNLNDVLVGKNRNFEIIRYATSCIVVGGMGKLLSYFRELYKPLSLVVYVDRRWSDGAVYKTMGFELVDSISANYWYVENYMKRHHRCKYDSNELIECCSTDLNEIEREMIIDKGYDQIWDCGQLKFELKL